MPAYLLPDELTCWDSLILEGLGRCHHFYVGYATGPAAKRDAEIMAGRRTVETISESVTPEGCVVIQSTDDTGTYVTLQGLDHE